MPVDAVAAPAFTAPATTPLASPTAPKQALDGEVFLQLLVTQLRNQDPSSPMNTNEMMAQTTQLAMMESLTTLQSLAEESFGLQMRGVAAALVGQNVGYLDENGEAVTGVVQSVSFANSVPTVTVDDLEIPLDHVSGIHPLPAS